jgi:hypothetical protein
MNSTGQISKAYGRKQTIYTLLPSPDCQITLILQDAFPTHKSFENGWNGIRLATLRLFAGKVKQQIKKLDREPQTFYVMESHGQWSFYGSWSGLRNSAAIWPGLAFSLTPALSRWEREQRSQLFGMATAGFSTLTGRFYKHAQRCCPLPAGEGQGEGECRVVK